MKIQAKCPHCGCALHLVRQEGGYLNSDQFGAIKAGDWYCDNGGEYHPSERMKNGINSYAYYWDHEV